MGLPSYVPGPPPGLAWFTVISDQDPDPRVGLEGAGPAACAQSQPWKVCAQRPLPAPITSPCQHSPAGSGRRPQAQAGEGRGPGPPTPEPSPAPPCRLAASPAHVRLGTGPGRCPELPEVSWGRGPSHSPFSSLPPRASPHLPRWEQQRGRGTGWPVPHGGLSRRVALCGGQGPGSRLPIRPRCREALGVRGTRLLPQAEPRILTGRAQELLGEQPRPTPLSACGLSIGSCQLLAGSPPGTQTPSCQAGPPRAHPQHTAGSSCLGALLPSCPRPPQHTHAAEGSLCPGVLPKSGQALALFRTANVPSVSRGPVLGGVPGVGSVWAPRAAGTGTAAWVAYTTQVYCLEVQRLELQDQGVG